MFRIRRIHDDVIPANRDAVQAVQELLRTRFPDVREAEVAGLPEKLRNPLKYRFRTILLVAERRRRELEGFALLMYAPDLAFAYLDYISAGTAVVGRGVGGALYQRVREEARDNGVVGLFFECLPDDPALCRDPETCRQNAARLRFYERYGARPIVGTAYETPVSPGDDCPPYLVFDDLASGRPLRRDEARAIVRAILERKYAHLCPREYVDAVVASFADDPVRLRPPRHGRGEEAVAVPGGVADDERIVLVASDQHQIHHVHERGYVESPVRLTSILRELDRTDLFVRRAPRRFGERHIRAIHNGGFMEYFKRVCSTLPPDRPVYPYVFPIRNRTRPPQELSVRAGYYCIDTFTPLTANAFVAARRAVDCALTGAAALLDGDRIAYALVRPPGHHAEVRSFGGFCYFNSAAAAAHLLSSAGPVAVLDVDYHHGNGQQDIFYHRADVLTVSIHGHPRFAYPYFSGFEDERGVGAGVDANRNYPLGEDVSGDAYLLTLQRALRRIRRFGPTFLVVALGLDTARGDPTGTWSLRATDFAANGRAIGALGLPTLVVQEGGYDTKVLGGNARAFFTGLWTGIHGREPGGARRSRPRRQREA